MSTISREPNAPPPLTEMFITSSDTLRHRDIVQRIPPEWNDRPPLFHIRIPQRRRFWRGPQEEDVTEDENPNLLKGVSDNDDKANVHTVPVQVPMTRCSFDEVYSSIIFLCFSSSICLSIYLYSFLSFFLSLSM